MSTQQIVCRDCGEEFTPSPQKKIGYVNQCLACAEKKGDVDITGGNMIWHHKTAPELEIKYLNEAKEFARKTKRTGPGPVRSIIQSKYSHNSPDKKAAKVGSGTENGAQYISKCGEKRTVKL